MLYETRESMLKALGVNLKETRLSLNISQREAAERSGISLKAVRNLEGGENSSTLSLISLCRTLKKTDWLMSIAPAAIDESAFERREPKRRERAMPPRKGVRHG